MEKVIIHIYHKKTNILTAQAIIKEYIYVNPDTFMPPSEQCQISMFQSKRAPQSISN